MVLGVPQLLSTCKAAADYSCLCALLVAAWLMAAQQPVIPIVDAQLLTKLQVRTAGWPYAAGRQMSYLACTAACLVYRVPAADQVAPPLPLHQCPEPSILLHACSCCLWQNQAMCVRLRAASAADCCYAVSYLLCYLVVVMRLYNVQQAQQRRCHQGCLACYWTMADSA